MKNEHHRWERFAVVSICSFIESSGAAGKHVITHFVCATFSTLAFFV